MSSKAILLDFEGSLSCNTLFEYQIPPHFSFIKTFSLDNHHLKYIAHISLQIHIRFFLLLYDITCRSDYYHDCTTYPSIYPSKLHRCLSSATLITSYNWTCPRSSFKTTSLKSCINDCWRRSRDESEETHNYKEYSCTKIKCLHQLKLSYSMIQACGVLH